MKCRLCGQPTVGQGKMCVDCVGALRRARKDSTVPGDTAPRSSDANDTATTTIAVPGRPVMSTSRFASRRFVSWATGCLLVTASVYFGERLLDPGPAEVAAAIVKSPPGVAAPPPVSDAMSASPGSASIQPEASRTTVGPATPVQPVTPVAAPKGSTPPAISLAAGKKSDPSTTKAVPSPDPTALALSDPAAKAVSSRSTDAARSAPDPTPARVAQAATAPMAETAGRDRVLASALARCSEAGFLSGVICEQKARLEYCEGAWDRIPQCTQPQREQR